MIEIWKEIKDYPTYRVSNLGRVKATKYYSNIHKKYYDRELILKEKTNKFGYKFVGLSNKNGRKNKSIHRIVAETFIENPNNYNEVNHIDGNKTNNHIDNLEWCTRRDNILHAYMLGLKKGNSKAKYKVIQSLNGKTIKIWNNISEIKATLGLDYSSLYQCCNNKRKSCNGFQWQYAKEVD